MEDYERIHESLQHKSAIKRERDLLEGIAPAIAFLEQKMAHTEEALTALRKVRTNALAEIQQLEENNNDAAFALDRESALAAAGFKTKYD